MNRLRVLVYSFVVVMSVAISHAAHAQFDGDPSSAVNAAPSPPPIIGQPPPQAPAQVQPPPAPPAATTTSSPLVGDNPLPPPPPPAPPQQMMQPPPIQQAPIQSQQIPPPPQMPTGHPPPLPPPPQMPAQNPPPTGAVPNQTQPVPPNDKPLGEVTFLEPYVFDMREGRRNPFKPFIQMDAQTSNPAASLPGTPLERYELEEIKLVGIMWQIKTPKAMFIDPQGEVHVLTKDDRIGRHHGYIATIRENEVVIVEPGSVVGESAYSTRILQLDRDQKDKK